ncbi:hypothetical protein LTS18_009991, partial [Coniosporium uncinatum]
MEAEERLSRSPRTASLDQIIPHPPLEARLTRSNATKTRQQSNLSTKPAVYQPITGVSTPASLPHPPPSTILESSTPSSVPDAQRDLKASGIHIATPPTKHTKLLIGTVVLAQCALLSAAASLALVVRDAVTPADAGVSGYSIVWLIVSVLLTLLFASVAIATWHRRRKARRNEDHEDSTRVQMLKRAIIEGRSRQRKEDELVAWSVGIQRDESYDDDNSRFDYHRSVLMGPAFPPPRSQSLNSWHDMMTVVEQEDERKTLGLEKAASRSTTPSMDDKSIVLREGVAVKKRGMKNMNVSTVDDRKEQEQTASHWPHTSNDRRLVSDPNHGYPPAHARTTSESSRPTVKLVREDSSNST